jgi:hypothetical protein
MTEQPLSDADYAYLRFVEFGELPARVRPEDYVEMVETESRPDRPEPAGSEAQGRALHPGAP